AEVIKIEKPGGDPSRRIGPFYQNIPDPERSLYWFAYNMGKKSVTLDIHSIEGQEVFMKMVKHADVVIESFPPRYLCQFGLDYPVLRKLSPKLIMCSVTPYGSTGPYKDYKASDLVAMAEGGLTLWSGFQDSPPLTIPFLQSYLCAGAWAAIAVIGALYYRELTGKGQFVDMSICEAATWTSYVVQEYWAYANTLLKREGQWRQFGHVKIQRVFTCKDGLVTFILFGGVGAAAGQKELVKWMERDGLCPDWLKEFDFSTWDVNSTTQEVASLLSNAFDRFFRTKTKEELFKAALRHGFYLAPVQNARDLLDFPQLKARNFWVKVEHPELKAAFTYPGPFIRMTGICARERAPLIGEHNDELRVKFARSPTIKRVERSS
ncbi:CaiB/BaiF CoA transferase family protein, partial [Chloroflexota bacterium]